MDWADTLLKSEEERKQKALENEGKETVPHMLHVVYLLKPLKGRPWWEKRIAKELQLSEVRCNSLSNYVVTTNRKPCNQAVVKTC